MNIYVPQDAGFSVSKKELFILSRPFNNNGEWGLDQDVLLQWGMTDHMVRFTDDISRATIMIIPYYIQLYVRQGRVDLLKAYDSMCRKAGIKAYGYIEGDWGRKYPEFENIVYFRSGGYLSRLSSQNRGFPVTLSDFAKKYYRSDSIRIRRKESKPVVGFCGNASFSILKRLNESIKVAFENTKRIIENPLRADFEPFFNSAYERARVLDRLAQSPSVATNFLLRNKYRAGAVTQHDFEQTTKEYYENIINSDYVVCIRGGGNFSVRFYETLMMGRIPIFLNTDCMLPFPDKIDWKKHVIWVDWKDRWNVSTILAEFHESCKNEDFENLQLNNRRLWKENLAISGIFRMLAEK